MSTIVISSIIVVRIITIIAISNDLIAGHAFIWLVG